MPYFPFLAVLLVVVGNLYLISSVNLPDKANAVLFVDSDAMLPGAVAFECFQTIARRNAQIAQVNRRFNLVQPADCNRLNGRPSPTESRLKELLRICVLEALDHRLQFYNVPRYM